MLVGMAEVNIPGSKSVTARALFLAAAATGTTVLEELYAKFADAPVSPDLMDLWKSLGVEPSGSSVTLHDAAPLAPVRRASMHPP